MFGIKKWMLSVVVIPCLFLSGCTKKITLNTYADKTLIPNGFYSHEKFFVATKDTNLLTTEIAQKITTILKTKGYQITNDINAADYYLVFNPAITEEKVSVNIPIYIPGGMQTKTGSVYGYGGYAQYQENIQLPGKTIFVPKEYTIFAKCLFVWIYDAEKYRESKQEKLVWQGSAVTCCTDPDIRRNLGYLLISLFEQFGRDTGTVREVTLSNNNKNVKALNNDPSKLFQSKKIRTKKRRGRRNLLRKRKRNN